MINAIRNDLILAFKGIKPGALLNTLFPGVFTRERKLLLVQLSGFAGGRREKMSVHAGVTGARCRFCDLQSCCEILHELQGQAVPSVAKGRRAPELAGGRARPGVTPQRAAETGEVLGPVPRVKDAQR